jgi:lipoprotein-anchoring transpeptidase ErfK/SrfK
MTRPRVVSPGAARRASRPLLAAVSLLVAVVALGTPADAASPRIPVSQPLVRLLADHVVRTTPGSHGKTAGSVSARRPLTGVPTILPVLGEAKGPGGTHWLRVRLPGRPNGHDGWIAATRTRATSTEWSLVVDLSARQVVAYRDGIVTRTFRAVVGKASTPTPTGNFFVEEAVALGAAAPGAPFALATSARSNVLQEFDGGPGQIALHGTDNIPGALGSAVSHGCVRVAPAAIQWLAARVGAGTLLVIRR